MFSVVAPQPGGVYMASMLGGSTLTELRACMLLAEMEVRCPFNWCALIFNQSVHFVF